MEQTEYIINTIKITRQNFIALIEQLTLDQINKIPAGFSNNVIWNFGHVMASQQTLCYERSGLPFRADTALIEAYKPTTFPEPFVNEERLEQIKQAVRDTIDQLREDYKAGIFKEYVERQTRFGVLIKNIDQAIAYVSTHETLHFGYAKALARLL